MRLRNRRYIRVWWSSLLFLFVSWTPAQAVSIIDTFGPANGGNDYHPTNELAVLRDLDALIAVETAVAFTPSGADYRLQTIELGMTLYNPDNVLEIWLTTDAGGVPGVILESFTLSNQLTAYPGVDPPVVITSVLEPILVAGQSYWVVARIPESNNGYVAWHSNVISATGTVKHRTTTELGTGSWTGGTTSLPAFRVSGVAVPEPSAVSLVAFGLLALGRPSRSPAPRPRTRSPRR